MQLLTNLEGKDLTGEILTGSTVIYYNYDGNDHHILIEKPRAASAEKKPRFVYYRTIRKGLNAASMEFFRMWDDKIATKKEAISAVHQSYLASKIKYTKHEQAKTS